MVARLGPMGLIGVAVFAGSLYMAISRSSVLAGILAAAAGIYVITRLFRAGDG